jgi:predicted NAD/FAD-dependent oxidoreductase
MAAHVLQEQGLGVALVDKGRSVGGRLATRRIGPGRADHGAQFFTVRSPEFRSWVDRWMADGLVYRWSTGWADGSLAPVTTDGHPRYAVQSGMNALAKHLAQRLDVRLNAQLVSVNLDGNNRWRSEDDRGQVYSSQALLLTPPVPQSLSLVDAGGIQLEAVDRDSLEQIAYAPCMAGLFQIDGRVHLPEPGALQQSDAAISWIADNQRKGISPEARVITAHAGPDHSRWLFKRTEAEALAQLEAGLRPFLDQKAMIVASQLKRWRYALPTALHAERCLVAKDVPTLVFSGDAFGGPRVEGAALSGLSAAEAVRQRV